MLQALYILVFTTLATFAVVNLVRNLLMFARDGQRLETNRDRRPSSPQRRFSKNRVPHPEFLDESGNVVNEPLLVMRSVTVEDIRDRLDALYEASPGAEPEDDRPQI